jgi:hypothetical protein
MDNIFTTYINNLARETGIHESSMSVPKGVYDRIYYYYLDKIRALRIYDGCPPLVKYGGSVIVFAPNGQLTINLLPET